MPNPLSLFLKRPTRHSIWRVLLAGLALLFLSSCASLSEDQCRLGQWQRIGETDGAAGHPAERFVAHMEACAEHGVSPVQEDYLAGHARGLLVYCTPHNAVREGLAGHSYRNVCPLPIDHAFADLHARAYAVYRARQDLESMEHDIRARERERRSDKTTPERRREISEDLRRLDYRVHRARDTLREREWDLDRSARTVRF